jgi:hypothetical protein
VSESIFKLMDNLPQNNLTTMMLKSLDFIVPGQWENIVGFDNMIRKETGEDDPALIKQIGEKAVKLYNDPSQGYQKAVWLYQTIDKTDAALGAAALANKVGGKIPLMGGLLTKVTPNPEKAQAIDLTLKLAVEIIAFCQINGIPGDSIGDFVKSLANYSGEEIMRLATLVSVDGLIPLGPNFLSKIEQTLRNLSTNDLTNDKTFSAISSLIPGGNIGGQLSFLNNSFDSVKGWMSNFVTSKNLTPDRILNNLKGFVEFSDDKLDYVAAFLDMSTNYYEHTGIQTVTRRLVARAYNEI